MKATGFSSIVSSGTCALYGGGTASLWETAARQPMSVFERSKAHTQQMIEGCVRSDNISAVVLRYFNATDASLEDGQLGEQHDRETHLIPNVLRSGFAPFHTFKLFGTDYPAPEGSCCWDFFHVADLAHAHATAVQRLCDHPGFHVCNLGSGTTHGALEAVGSVKRVTNRRPNVKITPRRDGDAVCRSADISLARRILRLRSLPVRPRHDRFECLIVPPGDMAGQAAGAVGARAGGAGVGRRRPAPGRSVSRSRASRFRSHSQVLKLVGRGATGRWPSAGLINRRLRRRGSHDA